MRPVGPDLDRSRRSDAVLAAEGVTVVFGGLRANDEVSLEVTAGSIAGLIGPNGAGKTTFFNVVTGAISPFGGKVVFDGVDLSSAPAWRRSHAGMSRTFQNLRLFGNLSVLDTVMLGASASCHATTFEHLVGARRARRDDRRLRSAAMVALQLTGLTDFGGQVARALPYGLQRRVEIARALAARPKLLMLDEPAAGMGPAETQELANLLRMLVEELPLSILVVEHDMELIRNLVDTLYVFDFGRVIAAGRPEEVLRDPHVAAAYLGSRDLTHA